MRWYYFQINTSGSFTYTSTINTPFVSSPSIPDSYGDIYGTYDKPFNGNFVYSRSWSTPSYGIYATYNSVNKYIYLSKYSINGTQVTNKKPCRLIGVLSDTASISLTGFSSLTNSTISGKYRLKNTVGTFFADSFICPISFSIKNENYDYFGTGETNVYGTVSASNNIVIGKLNKDSESGLDITQIYSSGSVISNFQNEIIDFGDIPQNIPTVLKNWIETYFDIVYPYSYTVKSFDSKIILDSIIEAPSMKKALLTVIGNQKTLTLTGSNDKTYTLQWSSVTPDGKQFVGLSNSAESTKAIIPVGVEVSVSWSGDIVLYEAYGIYRPPVTTFDINLYQKTCENNRVDKTNYITAVNTLSGVLREESSITDVIITFTSTDLPTFNYVYIEAFNRYYYVNDITSLKKDLWQMTLSVDVLMSYKEAILACTGFVDRNENEFNADLIDKKRVVEEGNTIEVATVTNELFTATQGTYLLNGILVSVYDKES